MTEIITTSEGCMPDFTSIYPSVLDGALKETVFSQQASATTGAALRVDGGLFVPLPDAVKRISDGR